MLLLVGILIFFGKSYYLVAFIRFTMYVLIKFKRLPSNMHKCFTEGDEAMLLLLKVRSSDIWLPDLLEKYSS